MSVYNAGSAEESETNTASSFEEIDPSEAVPGSTTDLVDDLPECSSHATVNVSVVVLADTSVAADATAVASAVAPEAQEHSQQQLQKKEEMPQKVSCSADGSPSATSDE